MAASDCGQSVGRLGVVGGQFIRAEGGHVEDRQETAAVRRAINSLPIELRQVVVMKEFEELTFREIADALDLPLSTVKSRLYTALKQLQLRLQKFESGN